MALRTWLGTTDTNWDTASNWSGGAVPVSTDSVSIPAGAPDIDAGLDQSAVALADFRIERGYTGTIGNTDVPNNPTFLQLDPDSFVMEGEATAYINFENLTPILCLVSATAAPVQEGRYGLYVKGNDSNWDVRGGSVGISPWTHAACTLGDMQVSGGEVTLGPETTMTNNVHVLGGTINIETDATQTGLNQFGGVVNINDWAGAVGINVHGGTCNANYWSSSPSLITAYGGLVNLQAGASRTLTALKLAGGRVILNTDVVTVTTLSTDTGKWHLSSTRQ